jgi:hypothetical protein
VGLVDGGVWVSPSVGGGVVGRLNVGGRWISGRRSRCLGWCSGLYGCCCLVGVLVVVVVRLVWWMLLGVVSRVGGLPVGGALLGGSSVVVADGGGGVGVVV